MKNTNNLVVLDSRRQQRNRTEKNTACDADLLLDIEAKIRQLDNTEAKRALLACWSEQAIQVGFKGMGLKGISF